MPLDPSDKAELHSLLRESIAALAADLGKGKSAAEADAERIWPRAEADAEHIWLTTKEAAAFLRIRLSRFRKLRKEEARDLVVSHPLGGDTEPRYQLAALRRFMLENAVGLPEPLPGLGGIASPHKINGKLRGVGLRAVSRT